MKKSLFILALLLNMVLIATPIYATEDFEILCDDGSLQGALKINAPAGNRAPGALTTLFASNNSYAGNMVDIVPAKDIIIDAIDINSNSIGETLLIDVFWKDGTCVGFETMSTAWTHLGSFTGVCAGLDLPSFIDMYGNGKTFKAGQTYGLCFHLKNYSSVSGSLRYTNAPPTTYSNADLSLTTWCGLTDPVFTSYFPDRMWNGTIYYDDPHTLAPRCKVLVNDGTNPVTQYDFNHLKVDFIVDALSSMGMPHDTWILCVIPNGIVSYTGVNWVPGIVPYSSGPLADVNITPINFPIPVTGYFMPICAIDDIADGMLSLNNLVDAKYVQFIIKPFVPVAMIEDFNDGVADNWVADSAYWSVPVDNYHLDCPIYARFVSYYKGSAYTDFNYTASMMQVDTGSASMTYDFGMYFRSDGTLNNCYDFYAEADGSVFLYVRVGGNGTQLYSNILSPNWNLGHDVWNTVSIKMKGNMIDIYINSALEASVIDSTHTWGYCGLMGQGSSSYDQKFYFDDVTITP